MTKQLLLGFGLCTLWVLVCATERNQRQLLSAGEPQSGSASADGDPEPCKAPHSARAAPADEGLKSTQVSGPFLPCVPSLNDPRCPHLRCLSVQSQDGLV